MSISRAIYVMVLFIVAFVLFMILKNVRLPFLKVFIYDLRSDLLERLWGYVKAFLIILFGWITMFMILLYFIWLFIKKVVPWPFKRIMLRIPPLPQLERAGIFALLGKIFGAIFSTMPFGRRIVVALSAFGEFIQRGSNMLLREMGINIPTEYNSSAGSIGSAGSAASQPGGPPPLRSGPSGPPANPVTSGRRTDFNMSEQRQLDDALQQCLEENLIPITPDMSPNDRRKLEAKNQLITVQCRGKNIEAMEKYRAFG